MSVIVLSEEQLDEQIKSILKPTDDKKENVYIISQPDYENIIKLLKRQYKDRIKSREYARNKKAVKSDSPKENSEKFKDRKERPTKFGAISERKYGIKVT